ncbi:MAG TPA: glycosyltransferase [Rhodanobacteraceae bacterium]
MRHETPLAVQILTRANGAGLSRDLALTAGILRAAGWRVTTTELSHRSRISSRLIRVGHWLHRLLRGWLIGEPIARYDINLMLERIYPEFFDQAHCNVLMPNPEWTRNEWRPWLPAFDLVAAKTQHAVQLFEAQGCPTCWTGFAAFDRMDRNVVRQNTFLHMPGRSNNKGSAHLIQLWRRHPEWPRLTVVWRRRDVPGMLPANVTLIGEYLSDAHARTLQNSHRFHLCPSQTEGFGHYIAEAMSVEAVVITTDAEPMNELIGPDHGVLVAAHAIGNQALATLYDFDDEAMEAAIERCLAMSQLECENLGKHARQRFEQRNAAFPAQLLDALRAVTKRQPNVAFPQSAPLGMPQATPATTATAAARQPSPHEPQRAQHRI